MLNGNLPVVPTPFLNGKIDETGLEKLVEVTHAHVNGYVICGSTGEAPSLTTEERLELLRMFIKLCPRDKEIVVGLGHTSLQDAVRLADV